MRVTIWVFAVASAFFPFGSCFACSCMEQPDSSFVQLVLAPGVPSGDLTLTISPSGGIETLASNGITIQVVLRTTNGAPCVGEPAAGMVLFHPGLCICPGGNVADASTDASGRATFTGTILGGGCADFLDVYIDGGYLGRVPVRVNSPDSSADCFVDAGDLSKFATALGRPQEYTFCLDFNEDDTIDAGDVGYLALVLGANCR